MSQYESALRLFEELDGLNDAFIEEGMLPDASVMTPIRGGRWSITSNLVSRESPSQE